MVTSNHTHLLVVDDGSRDVIPSSIKLVAGRTGQEYNQRKGRRGAFWEDRYHAMAVENVRTGGQPLTCERFQGRPLVLQFTHSYYYAIGRLEILA